MFETGKILKKHEYYRLITSGFLHANWIHLIVNMYILLIYAKVWEYDLQVGAVNMLIIYFGSLIAGNILLLIMRRKQPDYAAVGASGAVSGVVLSFILLFPSKTLSILYLPFTSFPAWIFGVFFILYSIVGIKLSKGRVGHAAHLGGAITGAAITVALNPALLNFRPYLLAGIFVPAFIFLILLIRFPKFFEFKNINDLTGKK